MTQNDKNRYFTFNKPEFANWQFFARMNRPGTEGWSVASVTCGWTTVHAPNWTFGIPALDVLVHSR